MMKEVKKIDEQKQKNRKRKFRKYDYLLEDYVAVDYIKDVSEEKVAEPIEIEELISESSKPIESESEDEARSEAWSEGMAQ